MKMKLLFLSVVAALVGFLPQCNAIIILNSAEGFAVLGASTVTSTGLTVVNGDLGVWPGTAVTGFPPGIVNGNQYINVTAAQNAEADAATAYTALAGEAMTLNMSGVDLGGVTLNAGVVRFNGSANLAGSTILYLDAQGNANARFDFQIVSTLTFNLNSQVVLLNGAQAENVYWQVGSSATLVDNSQVVGTIIANTAVSLDGGASLQGRAIALNGGVTMIDNTITKPVILVPEPSTFCLAALCIPAPLFAVRRRKTGRS